ncbi:MAG: nitrile hydratase subunit alpha [Chitinophagaceae bacterium]
MSSEHNHPHDDHAPIVCDEKPGYYEILEISIRELLIERGLLAASEIRDQIEILDSLSPVHGSKLVVRAWKDEAFKQRLLENGVTGALEMGITIYDDTDFTVLENTENIHHMVVCTLCSCYPRAVLGLPPDWYKNKQYRSRAVIEPRAVLAEFGTIIPDDIEIRVNDSTANLRYMVLPVRPKGTEDYTDEQLIGLVTRDTMIGVKVPTV